MEEIDLGELRDACVTPEPALVGGGDEAVAQREALGLAPQRSDLDGVAAIAPGIPLQQSRLVDAVGELQAIERAAGDASQVVEFGSKLAQHLDRQRALQPAGEQRIVAILVAELRR